MTTTTVRGSVPSSVLVADPGLPVELARHIERQLRWDVSIACRRLPLDEHGRVGIPEDVEIHESQTTIILTDHPLRDGLRPVVAEVHPETASGVVSLPSLGVFRIRERATEAVERVVAELNGDDGGGGLGPFRRQAGATVLFASDSRHGRLRMLSGMVRANRPWRLLPHLSKAFAAALAVLAYAILNPTIWQLAVSLDTWRLGLAALLAVASMVVWLIIDHEMWERPDDEDQRDLVALFNASTALTLLLGVLLLFAGLLLIGIVCGGVVLDGGVLRSATGEPATLGQHLRVVWLVACISTVAGAVGTGFESDEAVRQAAYGYRQRERLERDAQRKRDGDRGPSR